MVSLPTARQLNLLQLLLCVAAMGAVYYLDGVLGLQPCPLCMTQRLFLLLIGLVCVAALLHRPGAAGRRGYALLAILFSAAGGAVAGRHVWLQYLPADQVPACGPSLGYMLDTLPFSETLKLVMLGDGNCAQVTWQLFGLSIPELSLLLFGTLLAINLWQSVRG